MGKFSLAQKQAKRSKIAQFVHLSVTTAFYSGLGHLFFWVFLTFCMKLRDHNHSKLMELNFLGKFLFAWKRAKKGQNGLICVFVRYDSNFFQDWLISFFIFCMKLRDNKYSKLTETNFLGKFLPVQKRVKKAQNGPIYLFVHCGSIFPEDWLIRFVSYFAWSWGSYVLKTEGAKFFEKFLLAWKQTKLTQNALICLFVHYGKDSLCFHIFLRKLNLFRKNGSSFFLK